MHNLISNYLAIVFVVVNFCTYAESKGQYVQPVMMGMQIAIPYDIANIWNRPVSLSPFISTFLGLSLLYILFFGVITSPFGYMFGVPSQKYVLGTDGTGSLFSTVLDAAEQWHNFNNTSNNGTEDNTPRSMATPFIRKIIQTNWETPEFSESVFKLLPSELVDDASCQQLILCHAHNALLKLPQISVPTFRVFSKMLANIEKHQIKAIIEGLGKNDCDQVFQQCPTNTISLVLRIFLEWIPKWLRKSLIIPQL